MKRIGAAIILPDRVALAFREAGVDAPLGPSRHAHGVAPAVRVTLLPMANTF